MKVENFAYWLQGYFELSGFEVNGAFTNEQVRIIRNHLNLVEASNGLDPLTSWMRGVLMFYETLNDKALQSGITGAVKQTLHDHFEHVIDLQYGDKSDAMQIIHDGSNGVESDSTGGPSGVFNRPHGALIKC